MNDFNDYFDVVLGKRRCRYDSWILSDWCGNYSNIRKTRYELDSGNKHITLTMTRSKWSVTKLKVQIQELESEEEQ